MRARALGIAATAIALWAACVDGNDRRQPIDRDDPDDDPAVDARPPDDAAPPDAAAEVTPPELGCDPEETAPGDLCQCMADIVCDQIYYCLDAEEIADKPEYWSPRSRCVEALLEDCLDDLASDPEEYLPADFPACVRDLGAATCDDYGDFASVSGDFPATCENLRALDTGLGIPR